MYFLRVACVATLLCLAFGAPIEDEVIDPTPLVEKEDYRLPSTVWPSHYKIVIRPYLMEGDANLFTFDGDVEITIQATESTNVLKMHAKSLTFKTREIWVDGSTTKTPIAEATPDPDTDIVTYNLGFSLVVGTTYILHFEYTGIMGDDMHGFYRSSYTDSNNVTKWLGSTQFQTNHARRAFPSFDEPKFKAKFQLNIEHHRSMKAVSNSYLMSSVLENDYITSSFNTTPTMSSYLVAFIVSEFNERFNGHFGVLARPEYFDQTEYSFEVGQKILEKLDSYLGVNYYDMGIDKMHMAAIPDFSAGAMENWGLLTYRERSLLYHPDFSTLSSKQSIAGVVAHEQTHMWFGDYVTCDWWSYTWLNEGFARYFQYFGTAMVETELHMDKQFPVDQIQSVMNMDSTNNTNPMSDEDTYTPADLSRMFNSISYNKGASFIRMVKHVMGEENFQKSLQEYLKANEFSNSVPAKLFEVWQKYWPQNFAEFFEPFFYNFTTQVGYPVVHVDVATTGTAFEISQKRFLLKEADGSDSSLFYTIPITYTHSVEKNFESTTPKLFMPATSAKHTITLPSKADWVIANIQETGYYRVNYNEENWHGIHHALYEDNWSGIHEINRAQIVDDLFNLARSSEIEYELALSVLEYLETETNYLPWTSAFNGFSYLSIRLGTDIDQFGSYIRQLTEKAYKMLGFEEKTTDTALDIYNRAKILAWTCKYGNSECIDSAKTYFNNMGSTPVPVNIRSVVYCSAMRHGNSDDFDKLYNSYLSATVATEETLILNSLGCVKDSALVDKFFNIVLGDTVRRQDKSSALSTLYTENNENVTPVFKLVTEKYEALRDAMGGYSAVASVISNIASRFTETSQQQDLAQFNAAHGAEFGSSQSTLNNAEKTVAENFAWATKKLGSFKSYLEQRGNGSAPADAFTVLTLILAALFAMFLR